MSCSELHFPEVDTEMIVCHQALGQAFPCNVQLIQHRKLESSCGSNHSTQDKEDVRCVQTEIKNSMPPSPNLHISIAQIPKRDLRVGFIKPVCYTCLPSDVCWGDIHLLCECGVKGTPAVSPSSSENSLPIKMCSGWISACGLPEPMGRETKRLCYNKRVPILRKQQSEPR